MKCVFNNTLPTQLQDVMKVFCCKKRNRAVFDVIINILSAETNSCNLRDVISTAISKLPYFRKLKKFPKTIYQ